MLLETIRQYLAVGMYAAFASERELVERAIEDWEVSWEEDGRPPGELHPFVERTIAELLEQYQREQERWPAVTDCDRLDAAFAELDRQGILARQNFEQTLTSGCAAIEAEANRLRARRAVTGYVFYHEQDTESAVTWGSGPWLAWGAFSEDDEAWRQVARTVVEVLGRHGIKADWNGEMNCRIGVSEMRWQRRRTSVPDPV